MGGWNDRSACYPLPPSLPPFLPPPSLRPPSLPPYQLQERPEAIGKARVALALSLISEARAIICLVVRLAFVLVSLSFPRST